MFKNMKIGTRITVGFSVVLITIIAIIVPIVISNATDVVMKAEERELRGLFLSAKAEIESEGRLAEALSSVIAYSSHFQEAMARGDRDALAEELVPVFKRMKKEYGVRQFQFHTPPATSFLRVHKPAKFGDDLSSFRHTVVETNEKKTHIHGLEKGVAGLGIRGISPIVYQGRHLGSVEFGMSFGQPFFEQFKEKYGADIALYLQQNGQYKAFGSTLGEKSLLSTEQLNAALSGKAASTQVDNGKMRYAVYGAAVNDFSGKPVGVLEIAMDRSYYLAAIAKARNTILFVGLGALAIGMLVAWLIGRGISRPLCQAVRAMNDIAQGDGDLTKRLNESGRDELALLSGAFNRFAEKVRNIVMQVGGSTDQLATAAEEMSAIAEETNRIVHEQQQETDQVATAMNEMTATVQEVARHATEAAGAAHNADVQAGSGRQEVQQTIEFIDALASEVERASSVIHRLEEESDNIGSVLDVIKGIAEQTNLLALNAAIEAARAGEQGRGFAVVADEVRTLASRTQQSTQEIQEMIERLQVGAKDAVAEMTKSRERAKTSVEQAAKAGGSLEAITEAVGTINEMNTQIATAAEEQGAVAEEINRNLVNITQIVDQTAQGAQEASSSSGELAKLAAELRGLVGQFKT